MFDDINPWTANAACTIRENREMAKKLEGIGNQMSHLVEELNYGFSGKCAEPVRRNNLDTSAGSQPKGPQQNSLASTDCFCRLPDYNEDKHVQIAGR